MLSIDYLQQTVIVHAANGQTIECTLEKAAQLDEIEGVAIIHVSATLLKSLYDRIHELEQQAIS